MAFNLTGDEVTGDYAPCLSVNDYKLEHIPSGKHLDGTGLNLPVK